jgi:Zn-dependent protease with chaperone function
VVVASAASVSRVAVKSAAAKPAVARSVEDKPQAAGKTPAAKQQAGAKPQAAKAAAARLTEAELMAAFAGPLERVRVPIAYRLGIVLVAAVMVVLPLIYLGLIAAVSYGVYYHAINHTGLLSVGGGSRVRSIMLLVYAAPLFIGPVMILFMVKPLFARPAKQERSRSLTRQGELLLFAFVDRVCETVGAPQPKRIDVNCDVNASAGFRRGTWSMLGNDLVLTIGLPLVAGLSVREFGGVLAHEFGHFAQGAGMRLSYLVRIIANWFLRVVYQRDAWDQWLDEVGHELDIRIGWVVMLAQLGVMIGRGLLWVLMHVGFLVAGVLLRQMEFDADRYEARFGGSEAFARTTRTMQRLMASSQLANAQMMEHLDGERLVADLPALVLLNARTIPPETAATIDKEIAASKTGWFDTHPSDRDRLAAAEKLASPGIFHLDRPARELLHDFAAQSKATTWDLYLASFGPKVPRDALVPVPEFARASKSRWREPGAARQSGHYRYQ